MSDNNAVVGVYDTHTEAEAAIKELQHAGFDMKKLSIMGKDYHTEEHGIAYYRGRMAPSDAPPAQVPRSAARRVSVSS